MYVISRQLLAKMKMLKHHVKRPSDLEPRKLKNVLRKMGQLTFSLTYFQIFIEDKQKEFVEEYMWPMIRCCC
jgi:hypothetical protein